MEEYINIGKIDKNKIGNYRYKIITEEVILTNERYNHILEKHLKNSIMTFYRIRDKNLIKLINKNKTIYKNE